MRTLNKNARIYISGHTGMVGSAIVKLFRTEGFNNLVLRTPEELDLTYVPDVNRFFKIQSLLGGFGVVINAAAHTGGIGVNYTMPLDFLIKNIQIQSNIILNCHQYNVPKLVFISSSCVYPKNIKRPFKESDLLTGPFEETNEGYALAKYVGMRMMEYFAKDINQNWLTVIPCNMYGPNDKYSNSSHVVAALIKKFIDAVDNKDAYVEVWGSGDAIRELLHVDDFAEAILFLIENYLSNKPINVGTGIPISIRILSEFIAHAVRYRQPFTFNIDRPEGMKYKCMDNAKLFNLGYTPERNLGQEIIKAIQEYRKIKNAHPTNK